MVILNLDKKGYYTKFKMAVVPIYGKKTFKRLLLQKHLGDLADILHEAYGTPLYIK